MPGQDNYNDEYSNLANLYLGGLQSPRPVQENPGTGPVSDLVFPLSQEDLAYNSLPGPVSDPGVTPADDGDTAAQKEEIPFTESEAEQSRRDSLLTSGYDDATFNQVSTKGLRGYKLAQAVAQNKANAQMKADMDEYSAAQSKQKEALVEIDDIEKRKADAEFGYQTDLANMQSQNATDLQNLYNEGKTKIEQYSQNYELQLKELAAMNVDPGKFYSEMSPGMRTGTLVTAFITDFLGAKGIKSSGMDYINKAIDRDIDAQVQNIQNKRATTDRFKNLWEMQRAQSSSDYEAKVRIKGIQLEAFKQRVAGALGKFDSEIARARLPLAMSEIDKKSFEVKTQLRQHVEQTYNAEMNRYVQQQGDFLRASMQRKQQEHERTQSGLAREAARLKDMQERFEKTNERVVRVAEPEVKISGSGLAKGLKIPTGNLYGRVEGIADTKEEAIVLKTKQEATAEFLSKAEKIKTMQKDQGGNWTYLGEKITKGEKEAILKSIYMDLKSDVTRMKTGAAMTAMEMKQHGVIIPENEMFLGLIGSDANGGEIASAVINGWGLRQIEQANREAVSRLRKPTEFEKEAYKGGVSSPIYDGHRASAETFNRAEPEQSEVDKLIGTVKSVESRSEEYAPKKGEYTNALGTKKTVQAPFRYMEKKVEKDSDVYKHALEYLKLDSNTSSDLSPDDIANSTWFSTMDTLSKRATSGDITKNDYNKIVTYLTDKAEELGNYKRLEKQTGKTFDTQSDDISGAAAYFLQEILATGFRGKKD